jgi:low temperature requirement protein LtrA
MACMFCVWLSDSWVAALAPKEISEAKPRAAMIALRFIVFLLNTQRREGLYRYFYAWCR